MLLAEGGGEERKQTWALTASSSSPDYWIENGRIENGRIAPGDDWIPFSNFCVGRLQCRITNSFFHRETVEWLRPVKLDANEVIC